MQRTHYSGHLSVADIIVRSRLRFPPRNDLPMANTSKTESQKNSCKKFLYILFQTVFYIFFKYFFYFVYFIFEPVYGLFRAKKIKISWNFQSLSTSTIDAFPNYKDVQSTMGQGQEHKYNLGHILWYMPNNHFFTIRTDTNHSNSIFVHFVGWLFPAFQTLANQRLPNVHVDMISSSKTVTLEC